MCWPIHMEHNSSGSSNNECNINCWMYDITQQSRNGVRSFAPRTFCWNDPTTMRETLATQPDLTSHQASDKGKNTSTTKKEWVRWGECVRAYVCMCVCVDDSIWTKLKIHYDWFVAKKYCCCSSFKKTTVALFIHACIRQKKKKHFVKVDWALSEEKMFQM